jgi:hypothetical protein
MTRDIVAETLELAAQHVDAQLTVAVSGMPADFILRAVAKTLRSDDFRAVVERATAESEAKDSGLSPPVELNVDEAERFGKMLDDDSPPSPALRSLFKETEPEAKATCATINAACKACGGSGSDCSRFPIQGCAVCNGGAP